MWGSLLPDRQLEQWYIAMNRAAISISRQRRVQAFNPDRSEEIFHQRRILDRVLADDPYTGFGPGGSFALEQ